VTPTRRRLVVGLLRLLTVGGALLAIHSDDEATPHRAAAVGPAAARLTTGPAVGYRFPDGGFMGTYLVAGRPAFCIDLDGQGPHTATGYDTVATDAIRRQLGWTVDHAGGTSASIKGATLTGAELAQLAYLSDRYATTRSAVIAAAAEHVVRGLTVGDAAQVAREKVRWAQAVRAHPQLVPMAATIARDVHDHAGPYTLKASWSTTPTAKAPGVVTAQVLSASGRALSKVAVIASFAGASGRVSVNATTGSTGTATLPVPAFHKGTLDVTLITRALPVAAPLLLTPQHYLDAGSRDHFAQRMVAAAPEQRPTADLTAEITPLTPTLTTAASTADRSPADLTDAVTVTGTAPGFRGTLAATLWGPFPAKPAAKDCAAAKAGTPTPFGTVSAAVTGDGVVTTGPITVTAPGYYTWSQDLPEGDLQAAAQAPCAGSTEITVVPASPKLTLAVNGDMTPEGTLASTLTLADSYPGFTGKATPTLYGPFSAPPVTGDCTSKAKALSASVTFAGDGDQPLPDLVQPRTGYYTWAASLPATATQAAVSIACGAAGSTFLIARPDLGALTLTTTSTAGSVAPSGGPATAGPAIVIKSAGVAAKLVTGSRLLGGMTTPANVAQAAELDVGGHVGDPMGTIVIAGRSSDSHGAPGGLAGLTSVSTGDPISVTDVRGGTRSFVVDAVTTLPMTQDLPATMLSQSSPLRLVVVTGTDVASFGIGQITYTSNLIVTAHAV
jgi:hypothetical protein